MDAIIAEASEIAGRLDAADYSGPVPLRPSSPATRRTNWFFFVQAAPIRPSSDGFACRFQAVFRVPSICQGHATIASPPPSGAAFATRTDKSTGYKTNDALSVCLRYRNRHVGVAQFLNKRTGRFDSEDTDRALALSATLAIRVGEFMSDPRRIAEMGHAPRSNRYKVTIMLADLTNDAKLFDSLDSSVITDLLNQYFQEPGYNRDLPWRNDRPVYRRRCFTDLQYRPAAGCPGIVCGGRRRGDACGFSQSQAALGHARLRWGGNALCAIRAVVRFGQPCRGRTCSGTPHCGDRTGSERGGRCVRGRAPRPRYDLHDAGSSRRTACRHQVSGKSFADCRRVVLFEVPG